MMVSLRVFVLVLRAEAVTGLGEPGSVFRDIHVVPAGTFIAIFSDLISPAGDGSQAVCAQQELQVLFGQWRESRLRQVSDNRVALGPPGRQLCGSKACQKQKGDEFFHETSEIDGLPPLSSAGRTEHGDCSGQFTRAQSLAVGFCQEINVGWMDAEKKNAAAEAAASWKYRSV
jgi:hypothetical protein